jgi:hypothetical protein
VLQKSPEIPPEINILMYCARMRRDGDSSEPPGKLFEEPIDWDYLITAARYHRCIPFLFNGIRSLPETQVPPEIIGRVGELFSQSVQWNMLLTTELFSVIDTLNSNGIPSIPLKGPLLSELLYGTISQRQFDDLDILIQRKDFHRTKEILINEGYLPERQMTLIQESVFLNSHHHFQFYRNQSGSVTEIHWEISPRIYSFNLDLADLWDHIQPVTLSGHKVLIPSHSDMLLILCEHGSRHYWKRLLWIADIARLVEFREINWPGLIQYARKIGSERVLLLGISLAHTLFHAEIPPPVSHRLEHDPEVLRLTKRVLEALGSNRFDIQQPSRTEDTPDIIEEQFYLQARERLRDRIRYYARRATTPTREDLNSSPLPDPLYPFYPVVRIGRLVKKYKFNIWKWI